METTMPIYARGTTVSTTASRIEIENMLKKWGADDVVAAQFRGNAAVVFTFQNRRYRFTSKIPEVLRTPTGRRRRAKHADDQAERETWRAMALKLKSKFAATGVDEFEVEFQPYILMPDGRTIGEFLRPQIEAMYASGQMPTGLLMLEGPREG
jgi:hypothetical protein